MTTTPTTDGDETDEDETNDDPSHEGRYIPMKDGMTEGCGATLKDACGVDPKTYFPLLDYDFCLIQSCWTCTGCGQYCINVIIIRSSGCDID